VLEHVWATVRIVCDRGVSHEIVRHRLAAYSQESTRYCDYSREKFGGEITFIDLTPFLPADALGVWAAALHEAERHYHELIALKISPQFARAVLPNSLKTEIVMTCNAREWRHFFTLRTAPAAHPQMRQIVQPMLTEFRRRVPVLFDDVGDTGNPADYDKSLDGPAGSWRAPEVGHSRESIAAFDAMLEKIRGDPG
jgi:thymidylate synthase (FAD)